MSGKMNYQAAKTRAAVGRQNAEAMTGAATDAAMRAAKPARPRHRRAAEPLAEPVTVTTFAANRGGDGVYIRLTSWEGHNLIDVRKWRADAQGISRPGKGLALGVRHLPTLIAGLTKALRKAEELGLLGDEGEASA
jgi:hypothetical protein